MLRTALATDPVAPDPSPAGRPAPDRRAFEEAAHESARYLQVRSVTQGLTEPLSAEDCQVQSMPDASPVKWHLAHTTWFFETFVLAAFEPGYRPFHPAFRMLFNSYYEAVGAKHPRPRRGLLSRPSLDEVLAYRRHVDDAMGRAIGRHAGRGGFDAIVELGLNHEQQHQELILTDAKHMLSCNPLLPEYFPDAGAAAGPAQAAVAAPLRWLGHAGGIVRIGHAGGGFCFDNETPAHDALLRPFQLASRPVTEGELLAFVEDGGYRRPELWLSAGWDTVRAAGWQAPMYWRQADDGWRVYTLRGERPLAPAATAAHLSYYEADAYARWAGARLPTEAEWEAAALARPPAGDDNLLDALPRDPGPARGAADLQRLYGDVWEWTASPYTAYPGYRPAEGAIGEYNGKFMCDQWVLRGGSCATPRTHVRATYRNFFPAQARWQFSGLRLARDE